MGDIRDTCTSHGVESIVFSGIVYRRCRKDIREKILLVNSLLKGMCDSTWGTNTYFVNNENILDSDLYLDGLHFQECGTIKLANNILRTINGKSN